MTKICKALNIYTADNGEEMNTAPVMINMKQMRRKSGYRTYHDQVEHLIQVGIALSEKRTLTVSWKS